VRRRRCASTEAGGGRKGGARPEQAHALLSCESGEVKERIKEDENRKRKIYI
jgi:hypothetical protein